MEYNILTGAIWSVNLVEGNKEVPFNILNSIASCSGTLSLELTQDDVLVLDFDLGKNINISRIDYEFETIHATTTAVAPSIEFSYKNEAFDTDYITLETFVSDVINTYTTTVSGSWSPRYIRLRHDLSATQGTTTITGTVFGVSVLNDDTVVDFGTTGQLVYENIEVARGGSADIRETPIFNDGVFLVDALINIEPSFNDLDDVVSISNSVNGPWIKPLDENYSIFNLDTLDCGDYDGTDSAYINLRLAGWEDVDGDYTSKYSYGTYTTRIFKNTDVDDGVRLVIGRYTPTTGRLAVDRSDAVETIEVRFSNTPPKSYNIFRELRRWYVPYTNYIGYRDRWSETLDIKQDSTESFLELGRYDVIDDYQVVQDRFTERWAGWITSYSAHNYAIAKLYIFNNIGTTYKTKLLSSQATAGPYHINSSWQEIKINAAGGLWVYFFCQGYDSGDWCDQTGYYLAYFDSDLIERFKWYYSSEEIQDMDVDYEFFHLWYTRPELAAIYKISIYGNILVTYINSNGGVTHDLQGLVVLPDEQGIWFGNSGSLYRLSNTGVLLENHTIDNVADEKINYIALDGDGSEKLWILDGAVLGLLWVSGDRKGEYDFRVTLNYPLRLESTPTGCWVFCVDLESPGTTYIKFVSKENRRVDISYSPTGTSWPGPLELTYENPSYVEKTPLPMDVYWSNLEWQKVATFDYLLPETLYYQARLTLRRQEPIERYTFVTDSETDYMYRDQFEQTSSRPNELLWGNWLDKSLGSGLDRVYVDYENNALIMVPDWNNSISSYITTEKRVITGANSSGRIDIRVHYKFGDGNIGVASGREEIFYLYGYSVDTGKVGNYIGVYLYIPANPISSDIRMYSRVSGDVISAVVAKSLNYYEGTIRLLADSDNKLYSYVASADSTTFVGGASRSGWQTNGTKWYWNLIANSQSNQLSITDFFITYGDNYFYTASPNVTSMYSQKLLTVENIYPQTYKNVYIKTQVPTGSNLISSYETDLKVRWRSPAY